MRPSASLVKRSFSICSDEYFSISASFCVSFSLSKSNSSCFKPSFSFFAASSSFTALCLVSYRFLFSIAAFIASCFSIMSRFKRLMPESICSIFWMHSFISLSAFPASEFRPEISWALRSVSVSMVESLCFRDSIDSLIAVCSVSSDSICSFMPAMLASKAEISSLE